MNALGNPKNHIYIGYIEKENIITLVKAILGEIRNLKSASIYNLSFPPALKINENFWSD